ncbi:MAG: hypothetical protein ABI721_04690 [Candidatus Dojkabacteria bacterium]
MKNNMDIKNIKLNYNFPKVFKLLLAVGASILLTLLVNYSALEIVNRPIKTLDESTFEETLKTLKENDTVLINANINYLRVLGDDSGKVYYVGFEKFGDKLIARISADKIKSSSNVVFQGIIKKIDNSGFGDDLISKLNEPGNINTVNDSQLNKLEDSVKEKIAENLKGNFDKSTFLVLDGTGFEREQVYLDTIILGLLCSAFLMILLREEIFYN